MKMIIVGSGAGGATAARQLASAGHEVLLLEAGKPFKPFTRHISWASRLRETGLLGDERTINRLFPHIRTQRSSADLVLVRGMTTGGCTSISAGNAVRAQAGLDELGLDLTKEYEEVEEILKPTPIPRGMWRPVTRAMFDSAERLGLKPSPTPKMVDSGRCASCGLCELGCASGARWDSRRLFPDIRAMGGSIQDGTPVNRVLVDDQKAKGVELVNGKRMYADAVVLAAGGIGTAQILEMSGIPTKPRLWVDIVLTLGGRLRDAKMFNEPPMAWYAKKKNYIISPYPDILSHMFHEPWRGVSQSDRVGVMVKLADAQNGSVSPNGSVKKALTEEDQTRLDEGIELTEEIMRDAGVVGPFVRGMLNGGHLGGSVPLARENVDEMRPSGVPSGLWVADLSLLPRSQGLPTIMTTMALALRVSRKIS